MKSAFQIKRVKITHVYDFRSGLKIKNIYIILYLINFKKTKTCIFKLIGKEKLIPLNFLMKFYSVQIWPFCKDSSLCIWLPRDSELSTLNTNYCAQSRNWNVTITLTNSAWTALYGQRIRKKFGVTLPDQDAWDRKCQYGPWHWTVLTALLLLLHTRAGTVVAADIVGTFWRHWGQQGITWGNWRQDVVPYQFLHLTGPGVSI